MAEEKQTDQVETEAQTDSGKDQVTDAADVDGGDSDEKLAKISEKMGPIAGREKNGRFASPKKPEADAKPTPTTEKPEAQEDDSTDQGAKDDDTEAIHTAVEKTDTPTLSKRAIETAKQFGLDPEKLADMSKEEILEASGVGYNRKMGELGRWEQEIKKRTAVDTKAEPTEDKADNGRTTFADEDFDVIGEEGITGKLNKVIDQMRVRLDELESANSNRADVELADKSDRYFDGLDKEVFPDFGTGPSSRLGDNSNELVARTKIIEAATALQFAYDFQGRSITFEEALDRSVRVDFADNVKAAERRDLSTKVNSRRAQAGHPPTSRRTKPTAATVVRNKMDEIRKVGERTGMGW